MILKLDTNKELEYENKRGRNKDEAKRTAMRDLVLREVPDTTNCPNN